MVVGSKELAKLLKKGVKALIDEPKPEAKAKSKAGRKENQEALKLPLLDRRLELGKQVCLLKLSEHYQKLNKKNG
tara:strand:- start:196 stop:420 length:225 start_codon:yes stop_codon:yes gene_type:complete